jgi:nickel/cobalt exporter
VRFRAPAALLMALIAAAVLAPAPAQAHPLGNFTINHLTQVSASSDGVRLHYILDRAEIPTFQARRQSRAQQLAAVRAEVQRQLRVTAGGRRVPLRLTGAGTIAFPPGQGGLNTSRFEIDATAPVTVPGRVAIDDETYAGRFGLRALIARPGKGTAVRSSAPSEDPSHGLRTYPRALIVRPPDQRKATLTVKKGDGTLVAARRQGGDPVTTRAGADGFAAVFADAAAGRGALVLLLLASLAWGAFHALSPGHGKTMVAAYLVGTRGTARDAVLLGGVVTVTHTIGVFALGLVTLLLAQYVLPEDLYPWLTLASGLLVVAVGAGVLRSRVSWGRRQRAGAHGGGAGRDHAHTHTHDHDHDHQHDHGHSGHSHAVPERLSARSLVAMGASAGLIPCPSAVVVLLGAVAQHQVALGLLLILAFSLGLAATLTVLGLVVVWAGRGMAGRAASHSRLVAALPTVSALVILAVGCVLTLRAVPQVF